METLLQIVEREREKRERERERERERDRETQRQRERATHTNLVHIIDSSYLKTNATKKNWLCSALLVI